METIFCAAIWYKDYPTAVHNVKNVDSGCVVCGYRHPQCIHTFVSLTGKRGVQIECGKYESGFLTSQNRFVGRKEAAIIAFNAGQISYKKPRLYSEDIY